MFKLRHISATPISLLPLPMLVLGSLLMASKSIKAQQPPDFKVLISEGPCYLKHSGKDSLLKPGKVIFALNKSKETYIYLDSGSYLGLVHKSGRVVELSKAGNYPLASLTQEKSGTASLIIQSLSTLLIDEYLYYDSLRSKQPQVPKYGLVVGSISAIRPITYDYIPNNTVIFTKPTKVYWRHNSEYSRPDYYNVEVRDLFNEKTFMSLEVKDTFAILDFSKISLSDLLVTHKKKSKKKIQIDYIKCDIITKNNKNDPLGECSQAMQFLPFELQAALEDTLRLLQNELQPDNALTQLILARFYEKHYLHLNAIEAYQEALALRPEVKSFRYIFNWYLIRNGLTRDPYKLYTPLPSTLQKKK